MSDIKYISFSPYNAGLSNVIMSFELFFSIAYITKRKVILPPKVYINSVSESLNEDYYNDIWEIFDKELVFKYFDCVDFYEVPELQGKYEDIKGFLPTYHPGISYTLKLNCFVDSVKSIFFHQENFCYLASSDGCVSDHDCVIVNNLNYNLDFKEFRSESNRSIIDVFCEEKFLHFEGNLFGHYWYNVYPGGPEKRNELKKIINSIFRYKSKYYTLANKIKEKIGNYNSIHIRRGDFLQDHLEEMEEVLNSKNILEKINYLFDDKLPIYISTDETDLNFFDDIKSKYNIYFYKDFDFNLNKLEQAAIEQIICSKSEKFYGIKRSTYTKRINIMKACEGLQYNDSIFLNDINQNNLKVLNLYKPLPWKYERSKNFKWEWDDSSHPQWKIEENGLLKNYKFYN
jgi:hypothetical protein